MGNLEERQRDPWRSGEDTERLGQDTRKLKEIRGSTSGEDTGRSEIRNPEEIQEDTMRRREDTGSGEREREKSLRDTGRSRGPTGRSKKDIRRSGVGDPSKIEENRREMHRELGDI
jgi:hypothetical protein